MSAVLEPSDAVPGRLAWTVGGRTACAERVGGAWRYVRDDVVAAVGDEAPSAALRLGGGDLVLHLADPILLGPGSRERLWLALPLEVVVSRADGVEIDTFRPGLRTTMLGAVHLGRLLPAMRCERVASPSELPGPHHAALAVEVVDAGMDRVLLRRAPVAEGELTLAWHDGAFLAGTVQVIVHDALRAEGRALPLDLPDDAVVFQRPTPRGAHAGTLDWLIDATRRSTEFRL
ncbi:MAG: hypothetical protein H6733_15270 [Alphaproteobacteria bacterium]|nr:hypothetical protein [Alphaproteobacteria bacterium]